MSWRAGAACIHIAGKTTRDFLHKGSVRNIFIGITGVAGGQAAAWVPEIHSRHSWSQLHADSTLEHGRYDARHNCPHTNCVCPHLRSRSHCHAAGQLLLSDLQRIFWHVPECICPLEHQAMRHVANMCCMIARFNAEKHTSWPKLLPNQCILICLLYINVPDAVLAWLNLL